MGTSRNRPLLQNCNCQTLNELGKQVADYLPNKKFHDIRNMTEYGGMRRSKAFRHVVLHDLGLHEDHPPMDERFVFDLKSEDRKVGKKIEKENCYDVMEEAFLGMVRGYIPSHRRVNESDGDGGMYSSLVFNRSTAEYSHYSSTVSKESNLSLDQQSPSLGLDDEMLGNVLSSDWNKGFSFYKDESKDSLFATLEEEEIRDENTTHQEDMPSVDNSWLEFVDSQEDSKDEFA